jgi:hypothetical protein
LLFGDRRVSSWRRTDGERRQQQLKWLMSGAAICMAGLTVTVVFGTLDTKASPVAQSALDVLSLAVVALPVSMGVAILKYRLYDIDRIIRRALAYAGLVLLATEVFRLHQLPRAGTVRMRCTPVHRIHHQARIHHAKFLLSVPGASEGVSGACEAATSARSSVPMTSPPRPEPDPQSTHAAACSSQPAASQQLGSSLNPPRRLRPPLSQFARPVDNLSDLLLLL